MQSSEQNQVSQDEITLKDLFEVFWQEKWLIVSVTVMFALSAAVAALFAPKRYEASVTIAPVTNTSGGQFGALNSLATQFSGIASLAGIPVGGDSKSAESIAILQSRALTSAYIRDQDLLPTLYSDLWDSEHKKWKNNDPAKVPTLWRGSQYFKSKVSKLVTDQKTGLVTLTITWSDPNLAAKWANDLVMMANEYLRDKAISESLRNIAYLNGEAEKTEISVTKQVIYSILQGEINKAMLARGSDEYAFTVIDPAAEPESPSSPQLVIWLFAGVVIGLFASVVLVFLRYMWG